MINFPSSALTSLMYYLWVELLHHVVKGDEGVVDSDHICSLGNTKLQINTLARTFNSMASAAKCLDPQPTNMQVLEFLGRPP